jgi:hypothetical protein
MRARLYTLPALEYIHDEKEGLSGVEEAFRGALVR